MNLRTFAAMTEFPVDNATCISVGTDGFSIDRDNILSVSYGAQGEEPVTVYIRGADAAKVEPYTGVSPEKYEAEAVGIVRAEEILSDALHTELLVSYTVNRFTYRWLEAAFPLLFGRGRRIWFDVLSYIEYCDSGQPFPAHLEDFVSVCGFINQKRGVKFQDAVSTRLPFPEINDPLLDLPVLEQRIRNLQGLWKFCVNKEI